MLTFFQKIAKIFSPPEPTEDTHYPDDIIRHKQYFKSILENLQNIEGGKVPLNKIDPLQYYEDEQTRARLWTAKELVKWRNDIVAADMAAGVAEDITHYGIVVRVRKLVDKFENLDISFNDMVRMISETAPKE
jgi:hypothetical protein